MSYLQINKDVSEILRKTYANAIDDIWSNVLSPNQFGEGMTSDCLHPSCWPTNIIYDNSFCLDKWVKNLNSCLRDYWSLKPYYPWELKHEIKIQQYTGLRYCEYMNRNAYPDVDHMIEIKCNNKVYWRECGYRIPPS